MITTIRTSWPRSRPRRRCQLCTGTIAQGELHHASVNVFDGHVYTFRSCRHCEASSVINWVHDWAYPDEGVTYDLVLEWAPDAAVFSKRGAERRAARDVLARILARDDDGEGE